MAAQSFSPYRKARHRPTGQLHSRHVRFSMVEIGSRVPDQRTHQPPKPERHRMPVLSARFLLNVSAPCLLEWPDWGSPPQTKFAIDGFDVDVRLLPGGQRSKYAEYPGRSIRGNA